MDTLKTPAPAPQQEPSTATFPVTYWADPERKLMYRRISPVKLILLQVMGRDLGGVFSHRHMPVFYPDAARLEEALKEMKPSDAGAWEDLMCEYLQVNQAKRDVMNEYRQKKYEAGMLKLS